MTPNHWRAISEFPNSNTEPRMVKNFRVVVMMEQVRGPKLATVMKIKFWNKNNKKNIRERRFFIWDILKKKKNEISSNINKFRKFITGLLQWFWKIIAASFRWWGCCYKAIFETSSSTTLIWIKSSLYLLKLFLSLPHFFTIGKRRITKLSP